MDFGGSGITDFILYFIIYFYSFTFPGGNGGSAATPIKTRDLRIWGLLHGVGPEGGWSWAENGLYWVRRIKMQVEREGWRMEKGGGRREGGG